jgi:hypothetical protein
MKHIQEQKHLPKDIISIFAAIVKNKQIAKNNNKTKSKSLFKRGGKRNKTRRNNKR